MPDAASPAAGPAVIEMRGLSKHFGSVVAVDAIDLDVRAGEVFGFLGPNGAGKTTTLRLLLGLLRPTAGHARLFGHDAWKEPVESHRRLAYVPGEAMLWPNLTGRETLELLAHLHGGCDTAYRDELMERFHLDPDRKVRAYSTGNVQKVQLIAALMSRAELLLFDEPTRGLDPLRSAVFRECLSEAKERGQTVFLSSHILSEVEAVADRIGLIRDGALVEVASFPEMRHLAALRIEATYEGAPPHIADAPGVEEVEVDGRVVSCSVQGPPGPVLEVLAAARPLRLVSREPSLEELFMARYGDGR
jgi:ABC-2 type transport system ATP-binding protein